MSHGIMAMVSALRHAPWSVPCVSKPTAPPFRSYLTSRTTSPPDARRMLDVEVDCLPNSGCTLVALFLCAQLSRNATGHRVPVACTPDNLLPVRNPNVRAPAHHRLQKQNFVHLPTFSSCDAKITSAPAASNAHEGSRQKKRILVVRDPLANWQSLLAKPTLCRNFFTELYNTDRIFHSTTTEGRSEYDAVIFAEDMQYPQTMATMLQQLLGAWQNGNRVNKDEQNFVEEIVGPAVRPGDFNRSSRYSSYRVPGMSSRTPLTHVVHESMDIGSQMLQHHNLLLGYNFTGVLSLGNIHGSLGYTWQPLNRDLPFVRHGGALLVAAVAPRLTDHYSWRTWPCDKGSSVLTLGLRAADVDQSLPAADLTSYSALPTLRRLLGEHCDGCHSPHFDRGISCTWRNVLCPKKELAWVFADEPKVQNASSREAGAKNIALNDSAAKRTAPTRHRNNHSEAHNDYTASPQSVQAQRPKQQPSERADDEGEDPKADLDLKIDPESDPVFEGPHKTDFSFELFSYFLGEAFTESEKMKLENRTSEDDR